MHVTVWFKMGNSVEECEIRCICRLFEFRGMLCRHALTVLTKENVFFVPTKNIIQRWRKDVKRRHTKVKVNYSDWVVSDVGRRYDKMCHAFSEVADLASELDAKCSLVLHRVNELKSEIICEKISISSSLMCTPQVGSSNNDSVNIRNPPSVHRKGRPRSKRLKSTYEKIVTSIQKKNKNLQESDHNELGFGAMNSETTKKLSKKNKEENINDYYVQRDVNHNGYTNFTASIWWIYSELCSTTTTISFAKWFNFSPSIVQLQHLAVPMHQSSNINSLNAVFNPSNLTFGYPTTRFNPP
ncbi:uncharacterized protein [Rutidosis leptorrhynchoides]|uniref:uncharacterized protein isoform X2 n=1 Tax=Rutidosis leptorrhynchoides TaxID=125765 RepID=UPI003A98F162